MKSKIPILKEKKINIHSSSSSDSDTIHMKFDKISKVKDNNENDWNYRVIKNNEKYYKNEKKGDNDLIYTKKHESHNRHISNNSNKTNNSNIAFLTSKKYKSLSFIPVSKFSYPKSKNLTSNSIENKSNTDEIQELYDNEIEFEENENFDSDINEMHLKNTPLSSVSPSDTPPSSYIPPLSTTTNDSTPLTESPIFSKGTSPTEDNNINEDNDDDEINNISENYSEFLINNEPFAVASTNSESYLFNNSSEFSFDDEDIMNENMFDKQLNKETIKSKNGSQLSDHNSNHSSQLSTSKDSNHSQNIEHYVVSLSSNNSINNHVKNNNNNNNDNDNNSSFEDDCSTPTPSKMNKNLQHNSTKKMDGKNKDYHYYLKEITMKSNNPIKRNDRKNSNYFQKRPYHSLSEIMKNRDEDDIFDLSTSMEKLKNRSAPLLANLNKKQNDNTSQKDKNSNKDYLSSKMKFPSYKENSEMQRIKSKYSLNENNKYTDSISSPHSYVKSNTLWDYVII
ncbi:hypothetical protein PIROE2DRAFT_3398 [Piromyces sp. E2]|nr:hypothetical protein PIROE2DRAFT_3398 [Piromyces sp. E2]|eukprot:OUM68867.1 hypothetical protein PIROE2DRAFT_3398 [Piromyces sp. E2]